MVGPTSTHVFIDNNKVEEEKWLEGEEEELGRREWEPDGIKICYIPLWNS